MTENEVEVEIPELGDVERRVLGHLPVWRTPEQAAIAAEHEVNGHDEATRAALTKAKRKNEIVHGCGHSITSYTAGEMLDRLRRDDYLSLYLAKQVIEEGGVARQLDEELVAGELAKLEKRGFAEVNVTGEWMMTEQGKVALTGEPEHETITEKEQRLRGNYVEPQEA